MPIVIHGGIDGQLPISKRASKLGSEKRVWQQTAEQLSNFDIGDGEKIPLLDEVLALCENFPRALINIELKGPKTETLALQYNFDMAARKVIGLIKKRGLGMRTMISSFRIRMIDSLIKEAGPPEKRKFLI